MIGRNSLPNNKFGGLHAALRKLTLRGNMDTASIILIGPIRTGKTTLAEQVSKDLGLPHRSLDDLRWQYYREVGFDFDYAEELERKGELNQRRLYWSKHDP